jgi:hypothetical protein
MTWIEIYMNDLSTQEKRQARQRVLHECQISKGCFYDYLDGKQGRKIIMERIAQIIKEIRKPVKIKLTEHGFSV